MYAPRVTTEQPTLLAGAAGITYRLALERELDRRLNSLRDWNDGLEPAVDWSLEALLDDIRRISIELRQLRGEETIPF